MGLKPIAKRATQHASSSTRRSSLHHIVFAVEKICRVSGIKRKALKARKRFELAGGPLPSIAQQIGNAECAIAVRKSINRRGIPATEIEITLAAIRFFIAPREKVLDIVRCSDKLRDAIAPRWVATCSPSAHRRWLRRGSRTQANPEATRYHRTSSGNTSDPDSESKTQDG